MINPAAKLLVVGGSGFIGSHVVHRGIRDGYEVTSLGLRTAPSLAPDVAHLEADMSDRTALKAALSGRRFDYVVNCGGYVDHRPFLQGGNSVQRTHFDGLTNLVTALDRDALRGFVNIGSSDEYGAASAPQCEDQREMPISPYSLAKTAAAHFLQMLHRAEQFPAATLRLFLTYGPGQGDARFLPQIIRGCLAKRAFPVSAGEQLRDFCYIDDTVEAIFLALHNPAASGEVVNIASGRPVSIRAVIELVRRLAAGGEPQFGATPYRVGENMELYADVSKAKLLLGWCPKTALEDGIRRTIAAMGEV